MAREKKQKQYWLLKTEPGEWSWEDQAANGGLSKWDGVKNKQAQKNLKSMCLGDLCFFYHSGAKARRVVGVVSVVREWYPDGEDGIAVDVKAVGEMRAPVDLKEMKGDGGLKDFALLRQPRLSVAPVPEKVWDRICELGAIRPRFTHPWLKSSTFRAFSSSSSNYSNQSRGGLPRFFSPVLPPSKGGTVRVEGDEFWHMTKVLRLSTQDSEMVEEDTYRCIQNIDRIGLDFLALEDPKIVHPQTTQWHVFAALGSLKGGRADWLVEKCTELGASSITPLLTERSPSISDNRVGRLQRVILAAAKQCQRLHEMDLHPPVKVGGLLPIVAQSQLSFVAVAEAIPLISALSSSREESSGSIIIGPEGDFSQKELDSIIEAGAKAVGLGPHRLRVETATVALLATVMLWSDSLQPLDAL
ncbi:hypothetical protein NMG60_11019835 [Bertholletia excelsa]